MIAYPKRQRWIAIEITADAEAAEALEHAFNSLDSLGTEIGHFRNTDSETVKVVGYFDQLPNEETLRDELGYALRIYGLNEKVVKSVRQREIRSTDWLQEWKKHWKPTNVGRFVITPPWEKVDETRGVAIRIEPNMAFGTGTHETTRLCLKSIDENYQPGDSFLDVGTGTGILAIAAAKLTPEGKESLAPANTPYFLSDNASVASTAQILACDTDSDAIRIARENAELNSVGPRIDFIEGPLPADAPEFDFVCANLTIDVIVPILPLLLEKTRKMLVLSGILADQEEMIRSALAELVIEAYYIAYSGEWMAVTVLVKDTKAGRKAGSH